MKKKKSHSIQAWRKRIDREVPHGLDVVWHEALEFDVHRRSAIGASVAPQGDDKATAMSQGTKGMG
jgi:hypothetical protein